MIPIIFEVDASLAERLEQREESDAKSGAALESTEAQCTAVEENLGKHGKSSVSLGD